ncbi:hypothetical protein HK102_007432, partial [Quaeritorhiza haematococci]
MSGLEGDGTIRAARQTTTASNVTTGPDSSTSTTERGSEKAEAPPPQSTLPPIMESRSSDLPELLTTPPNITSTHPTMPTESIVPSTSPATPTSPSYVPDWPHRHFRYRSRSGGTETAAGKSEVGSVNVIPSGASWTGSVLNSTTGD